MELETASNLPLGVSLVCDPASHPATAPTTLDNAVQRTDEHSRFIFSDSQSPPPASSTAKTNLTTFKRVSSPQDTAVRVHEELTIKFCRAIGAANPESCHCSLIDV